MVVKIVHDQLIEMLGARGEPIDLNAAAPVPIMMVGLQGSGKTTTTAKLAKRLTEQARRKVLMASLDVRRPAAMEQLAVLGQQVDVERLPIVAGQQPAQIAQRALQAGRLGGYDVVMLDTAGRTTLDEAMMAEAAEVKRAANPHEVLLVADALTGQDAVNLARAFDERVGLTGIVLTRVDGDGRGGAALSMRAVTGKPIKLHRHRRAAWTRSRIFIPRASPTASSAWATSSRWSRRRRRPSTPRRPRASPRRCARAQFDLSDLREQLVQMQQMGGMTGLMGMLPGIAKMKNQLAAANLDERVLKRQVAIIDSMTPQERRNPDLLKASRKKRVAAGSGTKVEDINRMLKMHRDHGRRDEGDGPRQARADGGPRQHARPGRRHAEPGADGEAGREDAGRVCPGCRAGARRACRRGMACRPTCRACRRSFPAGRCFPASAASRRGSAASPDSGRRNETTHRSLSVILRRARGFGEPEG